MNRWAKELMKARVDSLVKNFTIIDVKIVTKWSVTEARKSLSTLSAILPL